MFLLRIEATHRNSVQLFTDFDAAWSAALEFVGPHNPVDGCSEEPTIRHLDARGSWVARSTSFGYRRASVVPIFETNATDLI